MGIFKPRHSVRKQIVGIKDALFEKFGDHLICYGTFK